MSVTDYAKALETAYADVLRLAGTIHSTPAGERYNQAWSAWMWARVSSGDPWAAMVMRPLQPPWASQGCS